jgi:hypothetical protein
MPSLGGSPLGLSFFSEYKSGNSFLEKYESYNPGSRVTSADLKTARGVNTQTTSNPDNVAEQKRFEREYGIGYRSFGDLQSRFTNNSKNPSTFYAYNDFDSEKDGEDNIFEDIKSKDQKYWNSDYTDQYSSISKIVSAMEKMSKNTPGGKDSLKASALMLKYDDFAYLKKLGVYPSNRLILARRFDYPIGDDLLTSTQAPTAIIPSWVEDGKTFIDITYGEAWANVTSTDASEPGSKGFQEYGFDEKQIQNKMNTLFGGVALTGFTEYLQYYFFNEAKLTDANNLAILPMGNPNIIRSAKMRALPSPGSTFEGLSYRFTITIDTEYEIKYIDGVDPTLAYFDIISNLLRFGTSEAQFQFDSRFNSRARDMLKKLSSGNAKEVLEEVTKIVGGFIDSAGNIMTQTFQTIFGLFGLGSGGVNLTEFLISSQVKKYRLKFIGIINALTGSPSGIYHITVGNPFRPLFSSGDLYPGEQKNKITLGPELGYNNLPTTIKFSTQLTNARSCGLQEIYKKFSPRSIRKDISLSDTSFKSVTNAENVILSSRIRRVNPLTQIQTSNSPISGFAGDFVPPPVGQS